MDIQIVFAIIFIVFLSGFLFLNRKNLKTEGAFPFFYFSMYRTSLGLKNMDSYAKRHKKFFEIVSKIAIVVGFIGMIIISAMLVYSLYKAITEPQTPSGVQLVLPVKVKGTFYVPFFYWLSCLTIIAFIHEFSHGVIARRFNIPLKSSGFAFLSVFVPLVPAAFVEPDEKILKKKKKHEQLGVFAAGPFSNLILAGVAFLVMILVLSPINSMVYKSDGVLISSVAKNFSAEKSGMRDNEIMLWIDNDSIRSVPDVTKSLSSKKPGDNVIVRTNVTAYNVELSKNPSNSSSAYLGVFLDNHYSLRSDLKPFSFGFKIYDWVAAFFFWLFLLNLGVGLFNLAPLGIVDGGRMLQVGLYYIIPDQKKSDMVWKGISLFFLVIVLALLFIGFFH